MPDNTGVSNLLHGYRGISRAVSAPGRSMLPAGNRNQDSGSE